MAIGLAASQVMTVRCYMWKNATAMFKKHEVSGCHCEAVDVVITLPRTTRDIGKQLSLQHAREKESNREIFLKILRSIRYLSRQGLPLRGAGDDSNGSFMQLVNLMSDSSLMMKEWLKRKTDTYTSHTIQNETRMIKKLKI